MHASNVSIKTLLLLVLNFRKTSFSRFVAVKQHRLSVNTVPHIEEMCLLHVLLTETDNSWLAISYIFGNWHLLSFQKF